MKILDIDVSENASRHIKKLCDTFQRPVEFLPAEQRQNDDAGQNPLEAPNTNHYPVYLTTGLDRRMFEANALYELFYIRQFETGFPALCKKSSQLFFEDRELVEGIGASIFTGVLDIEVYDRLRECGYSDTVKWFAGNIYNGLVSVASQEYGNTDDKYNFANLVVTFAKVLFHTNDEQDGKIKALFADQPQVLERSFEMRDMMRQNHPESPATAAKAMGHMVNILDLWDLYYIQISGRRIRTKSEFESFCTQ